MIDGASLAVWAEAQFRMITATYDQHPLYFFLFLPILLAALSRNLMAFAGALSISFLTFGA